MTSKTMISSEAFRRVNKAWFIEIHYWAWFLARKRTGAVQEPDDVTFETPEMIPNLIKENPIELFFGGNWTERLIFGGVCELSVSKNISSLALMNYAKNRSDEEDPLRKWTFFSVKWQPFLRSHGPAVENALSWFCPGEGYLCLWGPYLLTWGNTSCLCFIEVWSVLQEKWDLSLNKKDNISFLCWSILIFLIMMRCSGQSREVSKTHGTRWTLVQVNDWGLDAVRTDDLR